MNITKHWEVKDLIQVNTSRLIFIDRFTKTVMREASPDIKHIDENAIKTAPNFMNKNIHPETEHKVDPVIIFSW